MATFGLAALRQSSEERCRHRWRLRRAAISSKGADHAFDGRREREDFIGVERLEPELRARLGRAVLEVSFGFSKAR